MLFFNANFICYYFYPTKKREEPKKCNILKRFHGVECYYIYREKNWNLYFNVS